MLQRGTGNWAIGQRHNAVEFCFYVGCGLLLILAAALKVDGIIRDPYLDLRSGLSLGMLGAATGIEFVSGILVLFHRSRPVRLAIVIILFSVFSLVSLHALWVGRSGCGCLGAVEMHPAWMLVLDLTVLAFALMFAAVRFPLDSFLTSVSNVVRKEARGNFVPILALAPLIGFVLCDPGFEQQVRSVIQGRPPIVIEPTDLGKIAASQQRLVTVTIRNQSSVAVETAGIESSCDCLSVTELPDEIPGAGSIELTVRVRPGSPGWYRQRLRIFLRCERQPFVVAEFFGFAMEKKE